MTTSQLKLSQFSSLLKQRTNKHAVLGLSIAVLAVAIGTVAACYMTYGRVGLGLIGTVQASNPALWFLDAMPFLFALWGQYVGTVMAYSAGALVFDETQDLRTRASTLEYRLRVRSRGESMAELLDRDELLREIDKIIRGSRKDNLLMALMDIEFELEGSAFSALAPDDKESLMAGIKKRFEGLTRSDDPVAYLGEGHFALVLLEYGGEVGLGSIAARMRRGFIAPLSAGDKHYTVRPRIGVALYPRDAQSGELLLQRAALGSHANKEEEASFAYYRPQVEKEIEIATRLRSDLFTAIQDDQIALHYQPCLSVADMHLVGVRMVLAWQHASKGQVETNEIYDIADRMGQSSTLDIQKLNEFCAHLKTWCERTDPALLGFVRIAFSSLTNSFMPNRLVTLMHSYGVNPARVAVEVTEQQVREGGRAAVDALGKMRKSGLRVLLAGVGGHASLLSTLSYPIDFLMFDSEMVDLMVTDERAVHLARSLCEVARDSGVACIADGVWSEMHYTTVQNLGIDYMLGPYAGADMAADELEAWFKTRGRSRAPGAKAL